MSNLYTVLALISEQSFHLLYFQPELRIRIVDPSEKSGPTLMKNQIRQKTGPKCNRIISKSPNFHSIAKYSVATNFESGSGYSHQIWIQI